MILAADIGGTNTRLALFETDAQHWTAQALQIFPSRQYRSLSEIVTEFLSRNPAVLEGACFGVAGPVTGDRSETSNLAWVVDARQLAGELRLPRVQLLNDLEAEAHGLAVLDSRDLMVLNEGAPTGSGNEALIAAGTGLGEAGLHWEGDHYQPFPSEGGHVDFAPRDELEIELLRYLLKRYERVSYERVLSGPGLLNIYQFLRDTGRADEPKWLAIDNKPAATHAHSPRNSRRRNSPLDASLTFIAFRRT